MMDMSKQVSVLLVAFVVTAMCLPVLTISAWQRTQQKAAVDRAASAAYDHLMVSPTFMFDGFKESVQVKTVQRFGGGHLVRVEFECSHSGYGDRSGQTLLQVVTRHVAEAHVINGRVMGMVLDGVWDEMGQTLIVG